MKNKFKLILAIVGIVISLVLLTIVAYFTENGAINEPWSIALIIIFTILLLIMCFYAGTIEYKTSVYECPNCKHIFKPTKKEYIFASHIFTTRRLKCPECGEKNWCKRKNDVGI